MVQQTVRKINETYFAYALDHLTIGQIDERVFADVPSESDYADNKSESEKTTYRVDIDESDPRNVHATKCHCPSRVPCKHLQIVNAFFRRILRHYAQQNTSIGEVVTTANEHARSDEPAMANYLIGNCYKAAPSKNDLDRYDVKREQEYQCYRNYELQIGA